MFLNACCYRIIVTHNLVIQRVAAADLIQNSVLAACADLVKVLITLADYSLPNEKLCCDCVSQLVAAFVL